MQNKKVRDYFNERSGSYIKLAKWATSPELLDASIAMLRELKVQKVLDVGCGNGVLLSYLKHIPVRIGIDISLNMLLANKDDDICRIQADAHHIPFQSHTTSLVICRQVLHYCQPEIVLKEVNRVLTPKGFLHIVQLTDYDDDASDTWKDYWVGLRGVKERTHIPRTKLIDYVTSAGFSISKEEDFYLQVNHTWEDFFEKNSVDYNRQKEVIEYFITAPPEIVKLYKLQVNNLGVSYMRRFSLLLSYRGDQQ